MDELDGIQRCPNTMIGVRSLSTYGPQSDWRRCSTDGRPIEGGIYGESFLIGPCDESPAGFVSRQGVYVWIINPEILEEMITAEIAIKYGCHSQALETLTRLAQSHPSLLARQGSPGDGLP